MGNAIDEIMITAYEIECIDATCIEFLERTRAQRSWEDHERYLATPIPIVVDEEDDLMWDWYTRPTKKEKRR